MARAAVDPFRHDGWSILESFLHTLCDASTRRTLRREALAEAIDGRDPDADAHVSWLTGLLGESSDIQGAAKPRNAE